MLDKVDSGQLDKKAEDTIVHRNPVPPLDIMMAGQAKWLSGAIHRRFNGSATVMIKSIAPRMEILVARGKSTLSDVIPVVFGPSGEAYLGGKEKKELDSRELAIARILHDSDGVQACVLFSDELPKGKDRDNVENSIHLNMPLDLAFYEPPILFGKALAPLAAGEVKRLHIETGGSHIYFFSTLNALKEFTARL